MNIAAALAMVSTMIKMAGDVQALINTAQEQNRDLTPEELESVKAKRNTANAMLDAELQRRIEEDQS